MVNRIKSKFLICLFISLISSLLLYPQFQVNGFIIDPFGVPVHNVKIVAQNSQNETMSNFSGAFSISVTDTVNEYLNFYKEKYIEYSLKINGNTHLVITLKEEEFIKTGYGSINKNLFSGSVSSLNQKSLKHAVTNNINEEIQGQLPGVMNIRYSGEPDAGMRTNIRGLSSLYPNNPLYIVDGFYVYDIDFICPYTIESLYVFKDGPATGIFGGRGANGVILITTKKNPIKKVNVSLNTYTGTQILNRKIPVLDATGYARAKLLAYANYAEINDNPALADLGELDTIFDYIISNRFKGTDWQEEIFRHGTVQNYSINITGDLDFYKYSITGTSSKKDGIVMNSWSDRDYLSFNNQLNIKNIFNIYAGIYYSSGERTNLNRNIYSGILSSALIADPISNVYIPGTNEYAGVDFSGSTNPVAAADRMKNDVTNFDRYNLHLGLEIKVTRDVFFNSKFGSEIFTVDRSNYIPVYTIGMYDFNAINIFEKGKKTENTNTISNYFNLRKTSKKNSINIIVGNEIFWSYGTGSGIQYLDSINPLSINEKFKVTGNTTVNSYFGRINYAFDKKYLLGLSYCHEASSKISNDYRWSDFPSVSAGWDIKKEDFLIHNKFINELKFTIGWSKISNENVYNHSNFELNEFETLFFESEEKLKWERINQWNYGIDFTLFKYKIEGTVNYFNKDVYLNSINFKNNGVEISLNYKDFSNKFKYNLNGTITLLSHPLVNSMGGNIVLNGNTGKIINIIRTCEGEEIAHFYGFETDGLLTQEDIDNTYGIDDEGNVRYTYASTVFWPGQLKFVDQNNDGILDSDDKVNIGSANPDFFYGFSISFYYKQFDMRLLVNGVYGNEMVNGVDGYTKFPNEGNNNLNSEVLNSWQPDVLNPGEPLFTTDIPRLVQGNKIMQMYFNDYFIQDASYLRVKDIQFGYSLPASIVAKLRIDNCRIYISCQNLFTVTKYEGYDPEVGIYQDGTVLSQGIDMVNYPVAKSYIMGLSIDF